VKQRGFVFTNNVYCTYLNKTTMKRILFLLILSVGMYHISTAQEPASVVNNAKDTTIKKQQQKKIFINPGFEYISDLTYAGRKDPVGIPVLTPYINLILKKGFFLSATGYINAAKGQWGIDGAGVTPGYVFQLSKHFNGYVSGTKYFLADSSSLILASMKGSMDAGINFTPKLINAGITFDYLFGNKQDLLAGANLSRDITTKVFKNGSLKISPTVSFMAGTQSFYETYYTNTITKRHTSSGSPSQNTNPLGGILGGGQQNGDSSIMTSIITQKHQKELREFRPLNIGFYIPIYLHVKKIQFDFTPNLVFPFNQVSLNDQSSSSQLNKPFFFCTAGFSLIL
jgi:hypothetical protein